MLDFDLDQLIGAIAGGSGGLGTGGSDEFARVGRTDAIAFPANDVVHPAAVNSGVDAVLDVAIG